MSAVFEDCKGFVHFIPSGSGKGTGFYKLKPPIPNASGGACLIQGIPLQLQEIVQPVVTLDDKRTLYVFGSAWSETTIMGVLLLGDNKSGGQQLSSLLGWYESNRVSKSKKSVELSLGGKSIDAYIVGLRLEAANPAINTQGFSILALTSTAS
jgi:hypothetical protein